MNSHINKHAVVTGTDGGRKITIREWKECRGNLFNLEENLPIITAHN